MAAEATETPAAEKVNTVSPCTDSMVTVRLSDGESISGNGPPSLKLMTDDTSAGPRALTNAVMEFPDSHTTDSTTSSRRSSVSSSKGEQVDWEELEKTEGEQPRDDASDETTAFLLARLERENSRLETDPKAARAPEQGRPPSLHHLKKLMDNPDPATLRYSMLPSPPPLTDLDFYAALVNDYPRTASKLPFLLSKKIRSGVPPPLRGVVWISMSGARDCHLENLYDQLIGESSPYEHQITKDLGRTFPGVDIFSQEGGDGQRMLGRVLRAFSIYDSEIGYCQGLGFLVGPLLMHMGEREAFCVLVRLMENYELRSCFLPNMYGLHLRMFQLSQLLATHLPELSAHLDNLQIRSEYATQWFLSFFAVTCPLPMLLRIYDVIFAEGAPETIMRVALSLLRRNQAKLLASKEFEEVMQMLLGRGLWDAYKCNADDLVQDFVGLTGMVTREGLAELEEKFKEDHSEESIKNRSSTKSSGTDLQAVASRFLGRFWSSSSRESTVNLSPAPATAAASIAKTTSVSNSRRSSLQMQRTPSKQSVSTVSSYDAGSDHSTDATSITRSSTDAAAKKADKNNDLHAQIEDLLMAMTDLQKEHASKVDELRTLQTERAEERELTKQLINFVLKKEETPLIEEVKIDKAETESSSEKGIDSEEANKEEVAKVEDGGEASKDTEDKNDEEEKKEEADTETSRSDDKELENAKVEVAEEESEDETLSVQQICEQLNTLFAKSDIGQFRSSKDLADDLDKTRERLVSESIRANGLKKQLTEQETEVTRLKNHVFEARQRLQESHKEKQRLERTVSDLRQRKDVPKPVNGDYEFLDSSATETENKAGGLRQFKLGKAATTKPAQTTTGPGYNKRSSSLGISNVLQSTDNQAPASADTLLVELVQSKTAEAMAKQELEEVRSKLEAMKRMLSSNGKDSTKPGLERSTTTSGIFSSGQSTSITTVPTTAPAPVGAFGRWASWGKRAAATSE